MEFEGSFKEEEMKVLITYFSKTGNTEKLSRAIYDAVDTEKDIMPIDDVMLEEGYDVIFVGFPVHVHSVPAKVQTFLKGLPRGQKVALFATHGAMRGNEKARTALEHAVSLASSAKVLGTFGCRGEVTPELIESLSRSPADKAWCEEAKSAFGHPDKADLADGQDFARKIIAKAF